MAIKKYLSYERLAEYDALIKAEINTVVDTAVSNKANSDHNHDDRYYTETEVDGKLDSVNASITNITNGDVIVKEAEHATSSDTATNATTAEKAVSDSVGNPIKDTYETKTDAQAKLDSAKQYADGIKDSLLNGAGAAYDTLGELAALIDENHDAIDALETVATNKADLKHIHEIADVSNLQHILDEKVPTSRMINNKALNNDIVLLASDINAYNKTEIDDMEFITINDIDKICLKQ